jgi:hypothetical protein
MVPGPDDAFLPICLVSRRLYLVDGVHDTVNI